MAMAVSARPWFGKTCTAVGKGCIPVGNTVPGSWGIIDIVRAVLALVAVAVPAAAAAILGSVSVVGAVLGAVLVFGVVYKINCARGRDFDFFSVFSE